MMIAPVPIRAAPGSSTTEPRVPTIYTRVLWSGGRDAAR